MNRPLSLILLSAGTLALSLLAGCGAGPPATRFLFPTPDVLVVQAADGEVAPMAVRLAEVRLPSYLGDATIPYLQADGVLGTSPLEQWAEDPQQAITRALGTALAAVSGATVIHEPWPIGLESTQSLSVSIHRLLGTPGGETRLFGQYQYVGADRVLRVRDFDLREPVAGADTRAVLRSYASALKALAGVLAKELRAP